MTSPTRVAMPGQVRSLAAHHPAGPLYVTSYGTDVLETVLSAVDLSGAVLWQRTFPGTGRPQSRGSQHGVLWLARPGDGGPVLEGIGPDGETTSVVAPACDAGEEIGAFVVLDDGFCLAWAAASPFQRGDAPYREPRVARYARDGRCLWSAPISLGALSHTGVLETGVHTDWEVQPKQPWTPEEVDVDDWEPLLVSGDRAAASFVERRGGIGATFFLDLAGGGIVASTKPLPAGRKAIAGPAEFLIGSQGYGEFSTARYDRDGAQVARWNSHGAMLVDAAGAVRGPELENRLPSRSRFRVLTDTGALVDGPALTGYYTSYPALDSAGTAVFWRDGKLLAVDSSLTQHEYFATDDSRNVISRILLLDAGLVAFALDSELLLIQTPLRPLASGSWPCGDGNLHGNPVRSTG
ncbi:hypothetical protein [Kitasatospora viridis]|uniref:Uncharacterized protein n=1 Tax=Kitasatospora viridis TaxID=281105 RepID=A0A561TW10_9ACTN|nr:hypothetical protein FHX73_12412 [Kitasatospora viridis]